MNSLYKYCVVVIIIIAMLFVAAPTARAQVTCTYPGCFDGIAVAQILCTCSGNFLTWFAPLYLYGNPAPISGPLVFQPGTMKYLHYQILPTEGVVGTYVPGVQACWMWAGTTCVPIPNLGLILPDTGSSLPGGGLAEAGGAAAGVGALAGLQALAGQGGNGSGDTHSNNTSDNVSEPTEPSTYSGRLVITKGGTYTGNWESTNASYPAVDIQTSESVIIKDSFVKSKGTLINASGVNANVTITNTVGIGQNPDVDMRVPGRFLSVQGFTKVVVLNNYLENTRGIQIQGPRSGSGVIQINNNIVKNIDGRLSAGPGKWQTNDIDVYQRSSIDVGAMYGQFVQLNTVTNAHVEIGWNQVINTPYFSRAEDVISIYKSSGLTADPIDIHDNYIQGSFPLDPRGDIFSGGGIMSGDDVGSANVLVRNNTVVGTTNYGISASAGSNIRITGNRIISSSKLPNGTAIKYNSTGGNVGLVIYDGYNSAMANVSASNNVVGWTMANGARNDWYVPQASSFTGNQHYQSSDVITREMEAAEFTAWQKKVSAAGITLGPN